MWFDSEYVNLSIWVWVWVCDCEYLKWIVKLFTKMLDDTGNEILKVVWMSGIPIRDIYMLDIIFNKKSTIQERIQKANLLFYGCFHWLGDVDLPTVKIINFAKKLRTLQTVVNGLKHEKNQ